MWLTCSCDNERSRTTFLTWSTWLWSTGLPPCEADWMTPTSARMVLFTSSCSLLLIGPLLSGPG